MKLMKILLWLVVCLCCPAQADLLWLEGCGCSTLRKISCVHMQLLETPYIVVYWKEKVEENTFINFFTFTVLSVTNGSYFSHQLIDTVGILLVSGCGAVLLALLTESPVLGFEKLLLGRGRKQPDPRHSHISSNSSPTTMSSLTQTTSLPTTSTLGSSNEQHFSITSKS